MWSAGGLPSTLPLVHTAVGEHGRGACCRPGEAPDLIIRHEKPAEKTFAFATMGVK